ncbi:MAG: GGDEF domain-containing protein [Cyanobacteria bacterium J06641_5]
MSGSQHTSDASSRSLEPVAWLRQENQRLQRENDALKVAIAAATDRYNAIAMELQAANAQLASERGKFTQAEATSQALIESILSQKADLEVLVQTLTEHGDSLDAQWQQRFGEAMRQGGIDGLTQIPNRRRFDEYFNHQWQQQLQEQAALSILMLDVDAFKAYNDTYGHPAGDACLQQIAAVIHQCLQHPEDLAARYGGEEFVALLPRTDIAEAVLVARRIRAALHRLSMPHKSSPVGQIVTMSIGVASVTPTESTAQEHLIHVADRCLYQAKHLGRDRIVS